MPKRLPKRSRAVLTSAVLAQTMAEFHAIKRGCTQAEARNHIIVEWLSAGDAGPFIEWSSEGVSPDVLGLIAGMLRGDADLPFHLVIKRHRGAPKKPGHLSRDMIMALAFKRLRATLSAADAYATAADKLEVSEATIRGAVTRYGNFVRKVERGGGGA
jgi:hypothetical protein